MRVGNNRPSTTATVRFVIFVLMAVSVTRKAASTVRNQCTARLSRTLVSANTHTRNSTTAAAVSNHTTSILRLVSVSAYRHMMP